MIPKKRNFVIIVRFTNLAKFVFNGFTFEYVRKIVKIININIILNEGANASGASVGVGVIGDVGDGADFGADFGVGVNDSVVVVVDVGVGGVGNATIRRTPLSILMVMFRKSGDKKAKCGRICLIAIIACQRLFEPLVCCSTMKSTLMRSRYISTGDEELLREGRGGTERGGAE